FREYILSISETVDDRRPIRKELIAPEELSNIHNKWTFPTSLLRVLTMLVSRGHGEVSVQTEYGKMFSIVFSLVGIPLMVIMALDVGKFLSEKLVCIINWWSKLMKKLMNIFCSHFYGRRFSFASSSGSIDMLDIFGVCENEETIWVPIGSYVGCISMYCALGSLLFMYWERSFSFLDAFHFCFNIIIGVGLGDIVVVDYVFLWLIVAFVVVGLAVSIMSVDLASTHLKAYFTRIHYCEFARRKRKELSEELRKNLKQLRAIRRKRGEVIFWNDVRDFLDNELRDRPFEPNQLTTRLKFIEET
ncbi:hypothetical protein PMAYCL1PPCAC_32816, partial [Pristionchus mayeri]